MSDLNQPLQYSEKSPLDEIALKAKAMDLQSGVLGKFFGSDKNAPMNIAGMIGLVLTTAGVIAIFCKPAADIAEIWKYIGPLLGTILGFLFGRKE